ncbi:autophagy-related protein 13 [Ceratobasidium sp. AG-Ba]|nr:autophagy-related protein 13 [Ceratobasidium sp. AG-Ba]
MSEAPVEFWDHESILRLFSKIESVVQAAYLGSTPNVAKNTWFGIDTQTNLASYRKLEEKITTEQSFQLGIRVIIHFDRPKQRVCLLVREGEPKLRPLPSSRSIQSVVLEDWTFGFDRSKTDANGQYEQCAAFIRKVYYQLHLMPVWELCQAPRPGEVRSISLLTARGSFPSTEGLVGLVLDDQIFGDDPTPTRFDFEPIATPMGKISVSVCYRTRVDFRYYQIDEGPQRPSRKRHVSSVGVDMAEN